jgi:hypothetical protein
VTSSSPATPCASCTADHPPGGPRRSELCSDAPPGAAGRPPDYLAHPLLCFSDGNTRRPPVLRGLQQSKGHPPTPGRPSAPAAALNPGHPLPGPGHPSPAAAARFRSPPPAQRPRLSRAAGPPPQVGWAEQMPGPGRSAREECVGRIIRAG